MNKISEGKLAWLQIFQLSLSSCNHSCPQERFNWISRMVGKILHTKEYQHQTNIDNLLNSIETSNLSQEDKIMLNTNFKIYYSDMKWRKNDPVRDDYVNKDDHISAGCASQGKYESHTHNLV